MEQNDYLGKEKVGKLLLKFSLPCIFSLIISCLYNIVDQIFVGHSVGIVGNAATGIIFPITVVGWGLSLFFGDGASAWLSVSLGKGENDKIHRGVGNAILSTFISGCALILVAYLWGDKLLVLLGAYSQDTLQLAHDYGVIIYAMIPLALVQNCLAAIIRADGSPKFAMLSMIVGAVLNIVGDATLIFGFNLGIKGAAYATILGQFVSFVMCACYLARSKNFKLKWSSFVPEFKILGRIMVLGMSSFLTQLCIVATTIVNNILFAKYGMQSVYGDQIPLAAFVVIMKLFQIVLNVAIGIAAGALPIVGYNFGARKYGRVQQLLKLILFWTTIVTIVFLILFEAMPELLIKMFGAASKDSEGLDTALYMEFAVPCLRIYLMFIVFTCLQKVCAIFMQAVNMAKVATPLSFLRDILLIVMAIVVPLGMELWGVVWAAPIADAIAILTTVPIMIWVWRKLGKLEKDQSNQLHVETLTVEQ